MVSMIKRCCSPRNNNNLSCSHLKQRPVLLFSGEDSWHLLWFPGDLPDLNCTQLLVWSSMSETLNYVGLWLLVLANLESWEHGPVKSMHCVAWCNTQMQYKILWHILDFKSPKYINIMSEPAVPSYQPVQETEDSPQSWTIKQGTPF